MLSTVTGLITQRSLPCSTDAHTNAVPRWHCFYPAHPMLDWHQLCVIIQEHLQHLTHITWHNTPDTQLITVAQNNDEQGDEPGAPLKAHKRWQEGKAGSRTLLLNWVSNRLLNKSNSHVNDLDFYWTWHDFYLKACQVTVRHDAVSCLQQCLILLILLTWPVPRFKKLSKNTESYKHSQGKAPATRPSVWILSKEHWNKPRNKHKAVYFLLLLLSSFCSIYLNSWT